MKGRLLTNDLSLFQSFGRSRLTDRIKRSPGISLTS